MSDLTTAQQAIGDILPRMVILTHAVARHHREKGTPAWPPG